MRIETILNYVEPHKGFVYTYSRLNRESSTIAVTVRPRAGSRVSCPKCKKRCSVYDHQATRRFSSIPFRHLSIVLLYKPRRANCPKCGPTTEKVPWASGKSSMTKSYSWFLSRWAKRLPWNQVANIFQCGWHQVYTAVKHAVDWGLEHRDLSGVTAIGVDEICFGVKNKYSTLVYQLCSQKVRLPCIIRAM